MDFQHSCNLLHVREQSEAVNPPSPASTTGSVITYRGSENSDGEPSVLLTPRPLQIKKHESTESLKLDAARSGSAAAVCLPRSKAPSGNKLKVPRRRSSKRYSTRAMVSNSVSTSSTDTRSSSGSQRLSSSPISPSTSQDSPFGDSKLRVRRNRVEANYILTKNSSASYVRDSYAVSPSVSRDLSRLSSNVAPKTTRTPRKTSLQSGISLGPVKRPPNRAATVGTYVKSELQGTAEGREIPTITPTPFGPIGLRRTLSTTAAKGRDILDLSEPDRPGRPSFDREAPRPQSANDGAKRGYIRWQPSTKRTIMSRVLSGFDILNKSKSMAIMNSSAEMSTPLSQEKGQVDESVEATELSKQGQQHRSRSTTVSSERTYQSTLGTLESNMERTLASFPQPPQTSDISFQDSLAVSSPEKRNSELRLSNKLMPTIVTTKISIVPEVESVDTDGGQTIWVAVEVAGDVKLPRIDSKGNSTLLRALDVVVILDTSVYSSSSCFKTAREMALYISSKLDQNVDRFAIVSSADDAGIPQVEASLRSTKDTEIKPILKNLERPRSETRAITRDGSHLQLALDASIGMLQSTPQNPSVTRHGHIFVLTANMGNWKSPVTSDSTIRVHIAHPGPLPWKGQYDFSNGWQLRSLYPPKDGSKSLNTNKGSLAANIESVINHARIGTDTGHITDMKISVTPGVNCTIEGILGSTEVSVLRPGQTSSLFVKIKIGAFVLRKSSIPFFRSSPDSEDSIDLLTQLNAMLGEVSSDVLTVDVTHKHTLFPRGTIMTASSNASLRRHTPQSEWNGTPAAPRLNDSNDYRNQLQQRLAFFIATNHSPREALVALQDMFGLDGCLSVCPVYLRCIATELRYQSRVTDRYRLSSSVDIVDHDDPARSSINGFPGSLYDISNQLATPSILEQRPRIPSTIEERTSSPEPSPTAPVTASKGLVSTVSTESVDQAKKIWIDMRRARRWGIHGSSGEVFDTTDDSLVELKMNALRNKRSVGAETLKSMSLGPDLRAGKPFGGISPWL
jgi:hypothetical protein